MGDFDSVLQRQLNRSGIETDRPPTVEAFSKFLRLVNDHYKRALEDRAMLTRSMELSTAEMEELHRKTEQQRDQLRNTLAAVSDAVGTFGAAVRSGLFEGAGEEKTTLTLSEVKSTFSNRLAALFGGSSDGTTSEITSVRTNLVRLADQLMSLLSFTAERVTLQRELELAKVVQQLLVPPRDVRTNLSFASHYQPASECGGDWWCTYELSSSRNLVVVGDVTGHGFPAAMLTGVAKGACDAACRLLRPEATDPAEILGLLNTIIYDTARESAMMTCAAAHVDLDARVVTFANAGHQFPLLVRANEVRPVHVQGPPLGASKNAAYDVVRVPLMKNDAFVWYTDGLIEAENGEREQYGEKRLRATCQRVANEGARTIRDTILGSLEGFLGGKRPHDDVTLVVASDEKG